MRPAPDASAAQGAGKWPSELSALGFNSSGPAPELDALVLAATRRDADAHRLPKALRDNAAVRAFAGAAARALPPGRITEAHLHSAMVRFFVALSLRKALLSVLMCFLFAARA